MNIVIVHKNIDCFTSFLSSYIDICTANYQLGDHRKVRGLYYAENATEYT